MSTQSSESNDEEIGIYSKKISLIRKNRDIFTFTQNSEFEEISNNVFVFFKNFVYFNVERITRFCCFME
jgi:hypothetical protein